jgi:hypothetical protein
MAKTITIEFTDAQWELIKTHLPTGDADDESEWTVEKVAVYIQNTIKKEVTFQIEQKVMQAQGGVFDV